MQYLTEETVRDVLVEAVRQNGGAIQSALELAVNALIDADKKLGERFREVAGDISA